MTLIIFWALFDSLLLFFTKGLFTNYVYNRREVGGPKRSLFVNVHKVENVNRMGVGCQKKPKSCQRSL